MINSSFQFFPKTAEVLACKGDKNVYEVERGFARAFITAVFTFSLSGMMDPPVLIYTYKMFEEIVGNELVTAQENRRKNKA